MEYDRERPKILIVDDDDAIAELVQTNLDRAGFQTYIARSGRVALGFIYNMNLNGVVLDISMPGVDGFAVLTEMATHDYTRKIPTLMLSANYALQDVNRAIKLGAKDYLAKPFNNRQLVSRVTRLVRERKVPETDENSVYL